MKSSSLYRELPRLALAALGITYTVLLLGRLVQSAAAVFEPSEVAYGESIIYGQAGRLLHGEHLYLPLQQPPYTVVAYTPVYYVLGAGLHALLGPGFAPGRALSVLAGLTAAGLVAYLASQLARARVAGALAAAFFLILGFPGVVPWYAFYKEDVLGVALSLGAVGVLSGGTSKRRVLVGGLLAAAAVLTKQTFVAAGLAALVWLWRLDRTKAGLFAGAWLVPVLIVGTALELTTHAFVANTVVANAVPFRWQALQSTLPTLIKFQGASLLLAGLQIRSSARSGPQSREQLLVLFCVLSALTLIGMAKVGANDNYWTELAAGTAVLVAVGLSRSTRIQHRGGSAFRTLVTCALLLANAWFIVPAFGFGSDFGRIFQPPASAPSIDALVARAAAEPKDVLADPLDVVVLASRDILFEPYIYSIMFAEGRWDPALLIHRICAGDVGLVILGHPLDAPGPAYHGYAFWPAPVLSALRETMVLEQQRANRFVYIRALDAPNAGSTICGGGVDYPD